MRDCQPVFGNATLAVKSVPQEAFMRAIIMQQTGSPDVLHLQNMEKPAPADHELLVRLHAAGVNPIDTKLRQRGLYFGEPPAIPGCDGAGIVEAVGSKVQQFKPGDCVYYCYGGLGQACGNYAEYACVPEAYVAAMPSCLDFVTAAAAPLVLITAWESLFDRARLQTGHKVFIHAGAGGVGHVAIQLAKIAGCEVATSVSSEEKAKLVHELGADHIIRYRDEDVTDSLLQWSNGRGVDVAFDTVGGKAFHQLVPAVRIYGDLVTILQVPDNTDWKTLRLRNIRVSQELMLTPMILGLQEGAEHHAAILEQCTQFFEERRLSVFVSDILPMAQAAEAHRRIEAGGMAGKLVLNIVDDQA